MWARSTRGLAPATLNRSRRWPSTADAALIVSNAFTALTFKQVNDIPIGIYDRSDEFQFSMQPAHILQEASGNSAIICGERPAKNEANAESREGSSHLGLWLAGGLP
jgi:hypothetical protein